MIHCKNIKEKVVFMESISFKRQQLIAGLALLSLLFAACINLQNTDVPNPLGLVNPGVLTVASDTTNPPQEFIDTTTQQVTGFDIDLITAIARRMGLKVEILTTKIETLISDLGNKRIDVAISAIPITPDRQAKVNFIPYFNAGESLLVEVGNPHHITSLADLCRQSVGVQAGTVEVTDLQNASEICQRSHKPAINLIVLKNQLDVIQLLTDHRVAATYQDSPVTDYFIKLNPGHFAVGGAVANANLEGIAVGEAGEAGEGSKDNTALLRAMQTAFNSLKADGTYHSIIIKWGVTGEEMML